VFISIFLELELYEVAYHLSEKYFHFNGLFHTVYTNPYYAKEDSSVNSFMKSTMTATSLEFNAHRYNHLLKAQFDRYLGEYGLLIGTNNASASHNASYQQARTLFKITLPAGDEFLEDRLILQYFYYLEKYEFYHELIRIGKALFPKQLEVFLEVIVSSISFAALIS
jgi:hypothetical protein